jgi:glycosyltransferase involved in cell wall biosynthesis
MTQPTRSDLDRSADQSDQLPDVSLCFPVYKDENTVRRVTEKALEVLGKLTGEHEVVIVDDGSPDRSGEIADELAAAHERVRVIHHPANLGYGEAVKTALREARYEWICLTDGDDEYDVRDLAKLLPLRDFYDLVITFRYVKLYGGIRILISWVYNLLIRWLFRTTYRDVSTGLRLLRKSLVDELQIESSSPFIGAEITIKATLRGFRVGEVGIQTFPRSFGSSQSTTPANILATIVEMVRTYRSIFSADYEMPPGRTRRGE